MNSTASTIRWEDLQVVLHDEDTQKNFVAEPLFVFEGEQHPCENEAVATIDLDERGNLKAIQVFKNVFVDEYQC